MSAGRFKYPLEALLRKRRADWKSAKAEEGGAARVVDDRHAELHQARSVVEDAERQLRQARREGIAIDAGQEQLRARYLAEQRDDVTRREQALQRARDVHERVRRNLETVARGVKSLERHRAGCASDHEIAQERLTQDRLDELWLTGRRRQDP